MVSHCLILHRPKKVSELVRKSWSSQNRSSQLATEIMSSDCVSRKLGSEQLSGGWGFHLGMYICIYVYLRYIYIYMYISTRVCMYVYIYVYIYIYMCVCVYTHMYIHMYMHIHIQRHYIHIHRHIVLTPTIFKPGNKSWDTANVAYPAYGPKL